MRYQRDGWSVEQGLKKGRPAPDWYLDNPEIVDSDEFFIEAFHDLSTGRQVGMTVGPIPWYQLLEYARWRGLDEVNTKIFFTVLRMMDDAYMSHHLKTKETKDGS